MKNEINKIEFINEREKAINGRDGKFPPLVTPEQELLIKELGLKNSVIPPCNMFGSWEYDESLAWIQTYTGRRFTPTKPLIESIVIEDIAHALSRQCRFSGHSLEFYSIAQHSVLASYICDTKDQLWGLLHDASEAYVVDIPRPIKKHIPEYIKLENNVQNAICKRFELDEKMPESVKKADDLLLVTEARDLLSTVRDEWGYDHITPLPFKIEPVSPDEAKEMFLKRYCRIANIKISFFEEELKK